jgi:hypothetical protein
MTCASRNTRRNTRRKNKRSRKHRGGDRSNWISKISKSTGKTYYQHKRTGASVWEIPENNSSYDWEPKISQSTGKRYWVNKKTGESSWVLPQMRIGHLTKHCNDPSLTEEDKDYCESHSSNLANVSSSGRTRNIKYEIRKGRVATKSGCKLIFKTNNDGVTQSVPVCEEDPDYLEVTNNKRNNQ